MLRSSPVESPLLGAFRALVRSSWCIAALTVASMWLPSDAHAQPLSLDVNGWYAEVPDELVLHAGEQTDSLPSVTSPVGVYGRFEIKTRRVGPMTRRQAETFKWPHEVRMRTIFSDGSSKAGAWFENRQGDGLSEVVVAIPAAVTWSQGAGYRVPADLIALGSHTNLAKRRWTFGDKGRFPQSRAVWERNMVTYSDRSPRVIFSGANAPVAPDGDPLGARAAELWRDLPRVYQVGREWLSQQGPKFRHWLPHWLIETGEPAK